MDDAVGCAFCRWRKGGGVNRAGNSRPVGEGSPGNGGVGLNEIGGSLGEGEGDCCCIASTQSVVSIVLCDGDGGPCGVDGEGDGVVGVVFVLVGVASSIREFFVGDVNFAHGGAVCVWSEGG